MTKHYIRKELRGLRPQSYIWDDLCVGLLTISGGYARMTAAEKSAFLRMEAGHVAVRTDFGNGNCWLVIEDVHEDPVSTASGKPSDPFRPGLV